MKLRAAALAGLALAIPTAAVADGTGSFTYAEWLNVEAGMTKAHIENVICRCSPDYVLVGRRTRTVWYANGTPGELRITYAHHPRVAIHSSWCNHPTSDCSQEF